MFKANGYYIIESKEEFLKNWDASWKRYDNAVMPYGFDVETATFPMALVYCESWDAHFCGSWDYQDVAETKEIILKAYQEEIDFFIKKKFELNQFEA